MINIKNEKNMKMLHFLKNSFLRKERLRLKFIFLLNHLLKKKENIFFIYQIFVDIKYLDKYYIIYVYYTYMHYWFQSFKLYNSSFSKKIISRVIYNDTLQNLRKRM